MRFILSSNFFNNLYLEIGEPTVPSFTERYHELTKYHPNSIDKLGSVYWDEQPYPFKEELPYEVIPLNPYKNSSLRKISQRPVKQILPTLYALLQNTCGVTSNLKVGDQSHFLRANPSAGALYPVECYLAVIQDFVDLPSGIYYYHPLENNLYIIRQDAVCESLQSIFFEAPSLQHSELFIAYTGMYSRGVWRYKERTYRRMLLDAGHTVANTLEMCEYLGISVSLLGGFVDVELSELLELNPRDEVPLLGAALSLSSPLSAIEIGQYAGEKPLEAVKRISKSASLQFQQNTCESMVRTGEIPTPIGQSLLRPHYEPNSLPIPDLIQNRRSAREFSGKQMALDDFTRILRFAYRQLEYCDWGLCNKYLESYLIVLRIEDMLPGLYKLNPSSLAIQLLQEGDFQAQAYQICLGQELAASCCFLLIHTSHVSDLVQEYGDRGYRYINLEAGQIGQRINLISQHLGLGSSGIGGYFDDMTNEILDLPLTSGVHYISTVGIPA